MQSVLSGTHFGSYNTEPKKENSGAGNTVEEKKGFSRYEVTKSFVTGFVKSLNPNFKTESFEHQTPKQAEIPPVDFAMPKPQDCLNLAGRLIIAASPLTYVGKGVSLFMGVSTLAGLASGASVGSVNDPGKTDQKIINLGSANDLARVGKDKDFPLDGHYVLSNDICAPDLKTLPGKFTGIFDGSGHTIQGLKEPLFSKLSEKGIVKNTVFANANIQRQNDFTEINGRIHPETQHEFTPVSGERAIYEVDRSNKPIGVVVNHLDGEASIQNITVTGCSLKIIEEKSMTLYQTESNGVPFYSTELLTSCDKSCPKVELDIKGKNVNAGLIVGNVEGGWVSNSCAQIVNSKVVDSQISASGNEYSVGNIVGKVIEKVCIDGNEVRNNTITTNGHRGNAGCLVGYGAHGSSAEYRDNKGFNNRISMDGDEVSAGGAFGKIAANAEANLEGLQLVDNTIHAEGTGSSAGCIAGTEKSYELENTCNSATMSGMDVQGGSLEAELVGLDTPVGRSCYTRTATSDMQVCKVELTGKTDFNSTITYEWYSGRNKIDKTMTADRDNLGTQEGQTKEGYTAQLNKALLGNDCSNKNPLFPESMPVAANPCSQTTAKTSLSTTPATVPPAGKEVPSIDIFPHGLGWAAGFFVFAALLGFGFYGFKKYSQNKAVESGKAMIPVEDVCENETKNSVNENEHESQNLV